MKFGYTKDSYPFLQKPIKISEQKWAEEIEPLVSISCLAYKHENYIRTAIEGFLMQETNFKVEILIHDDASPDRTADIIREYEAKFHQLIKPKYQKDNQFSQIGCLVGGLDLKRAQGKYIALCEGDDYWTDPYKLQKQVDFLENNPDYGMVHSDWDIIFTKNKKIIRSINKTRNIHIPKKNYFDELLLNNYIGTLTVSVRKALIVNFFELHLNKYIEWKMGDLPLWLYLAKHSKIGYIDQSFAVKRELPESLSNNKDKRKRYAYKKSGYDIRFYFANIYGCSKSTKLKLKKKYNEFNLKYSVLLGKKKEAKKSYTFLKQNESDFKKKLKYFYIFLGTKSFFVSFLLGLYLLVNEKIEEFPYGEKIKYLALFRNLMKTKIK
ncbi:MAG: glycosyltransferase [Candidatus Helarchaeota archaeon]